MINFIYFGSVISDQLKSRGYDKTLIDKIVMLKWFKQNAELLEERRKDITDLFLQNCKEKY